MKTLLIKNLLDSNIRVEEFNKSEHMIYASKIMDLDEELSKSQEDFNPAKFDDNPSLGEISYQKYIELLLDNNWRLFVILLRDICIGYIHISPGWYKNSAYIGSFIITKKYTHKGYGKIALKQLIAMIKRDYDLVVLNVAIKNKPAVSLYESLGFNASHLSMSLKLK